VSPVALAAALGLSGCLLLSHPVNKAPTVKIAPKDAPSAIYRHTTLNFVVTAISDDKDSADTLQLRWNDFPLDEGKTCNGISSGDWPKNRSPVEAQDGHSFDVDSLKVTCVCAQVTDQSGATGQDCYRVSPQNAPPKAVIIDVSGAVSSQPRPLCSQIHLTGEESDYSPEDPVDFQWRIEYSGSDSGGKAVQLGECAGVGSKRNAHRCFNTSVAGTYKITLTLVDSADSPPTTSVADPFMVVVNGDAPPCIRRTEPDVLAQYTMLSRGELGGSYQSRTFKALSVDDDCEPYPALSNSTGSTQFVWSVRDATRPSDAGPPRWTPQTITGDSFTVVQGQFPDARPGDEIKVRLEVRDSAVQRMYSDPNYSVCDESTDICVDANNCVRWTTWTVRFQP
jgi:hypothetical protein